MSDVRLRIEGPPKDLERLHGELKDLPDGATIQPITTDIPGELRDPVLTALMVGIQSSSVLVAFVAILKRSMSHRERMEELRIYEENSDREITIAEFLARRSDS